MSNAIEGTLILVALGSLIGIPIGILSGVYIAEYGNNRFGATIRFLGDVLAGYLPAQLTDGELTSMVSAAIAETGAVGMQGMGKVMKAVTPQVAGRADGARVAAEVRRQLAAST